jgi:hypothetical protein
VHKDFVACCVSGEEVVNDFDVCPSLSYKPSCVTLTVKTQKMKKGAAAAAAAAAGSGGVGSTVAAVAAAALAAVGLGPHNPLPHSRESAAGGAASGATRSGSSGTKGGDGGEEDEEEIEHIAILENKCSTRQANVSIFGWNTNTSRATTWVSLMLGPLTRRTFFGVLGACLKSESVVNLHVCGSASGGQAIPSSADPLPASALAAQAKCLRRSYSNRTAGSGAPGAAAVSSFCNLTNVYVFLSFSCSP